MRQTARQMRIQAEQRQQLLNPRANAGLRPAEQRRYGGDILLYRPVGKQADRLNGVAHAPT